MKTSVFKSYLNIGFILSPTSTNFVFAFVHRCLNHRSIFIYPPLNSRMVKLNASDFYQLFNVSIVKCKLKVNSLKHNEIRISVMLQHGKRILIPIITIYIWYINGKEPIPHFYWNFSIVNTLCQLKLSFGATSIAINNSGLITCACPQRFTRLVLKLPCSEMLILFL